MYNRYIPAEASYAPVGPSSAPPGPQRSGDNGPPPLRSRPGGLGSLLSGLLQGSRGEHGGKGVSQTIDALLKSFHLEHLDTGDILLALIVLFLILEDGDDLDLIIALGLIILFSLGES